MLFEGEVIGVIDSEADEKGYYSKDDAEKLTTLATLAAPRIVSAQLQASEEKYRRLFEDVADGIFRLTPEGRLLLCNPALMEMFGYESEEEVRRLYLARDVYTDPNEFLRQTEQLKSDGRVRNAEITMKHKNGTVVTVLGNVRSVRDDQGQVLYFEGILRDITERKRLEDQLRQSQKVEAVGLLAGGIAHGFNNLLTVINGYTELALERLSSEDSMTSHLSKVRDAGERAAALTRQLLAFSRQQRLAPTVLDLNEVVTAVEKLLSHTIGEDIELILKLEPRLMRVKADPSQMEQVLLNLAVNARDAMPGGGRLTLATSNINLGPNATRDRNLPAQSGAYVTLVVSDTGGGMDEETRGRIFDPFFTTKDQGEGTGLGLSTVLGIVKQSGGFIWVESEPDNGAAFHIWLPRSEETADGVGESVEVCQGDGRPSETILLVEDERSVREYAVEVLESKGYRLLVAEHPREALEVCEAHADTIELLVTDVVMPGGTGQELAAEILISRPETRVLFVSGYSESRSKNRLDAASAFLAKPFSPAELTQKVREVIDGSLKRAVVQSR